jgi:alpha-D-ribose 1-methylphosphonate 5-triphosphate diphosphatase
MSGMNYWLENARVVLPDQTLEHGFVRIEDGYIAEIQDAPEKTSNLPRVDLSQQTLIPGIVDIHGDMLERELEPRPNTQFPIKVALAELDKRLCSNGITTAFAAVALADGPGLRSESRAESLIHAIHQAKDELRSQILVHVRFEVSVPSGVPLLERLLQENLVQMVSLMDHTPGQGQFRNLEYYVEYMTKWLGGNREAAQRTAQAHLETPISWEVARGIAGLAVDRQIPLASHDDDTPEKVAVMQQLGTSIAEFPVTLGAAQAAAEAGMKVIMGAPNALRGGSHSGNLSALEGIDAGVVHGLCADYHPASLLHAALRIAESGLPLHTAIRFVSFEPAKAAGLVRRGAIQTGFFADLTVLRGSRVAATWREGKLIYADSQF